MAGLEGPQLDQHLKTGQRQTMLYKLFTMFHNLIVSSRIRDSAHLFHQASDKNLGISQLQLYMKHFFMQHTTQLNVDVVDVESTRDQC